MKETNTNFENINDFPLQEAIFGGGCFWCTEAVFQNIEGVDKVISGYCGGNVENPSYKQICEGNTGHAEVIKIIFDSSKVSYLQLLKVFFEIHDPTTINRQGNDIGTQYRSVIFPTNEEQKYIIQNTIESLNSSGKYSSRIVTTIEDFDKFYLAENYHQNYYNLNKSQPYCKFVIQAKILKFEENFDHLIKTK